MATQSQQATAELKKGLITAQDTLATSGTLNDVQANQFIDYVRDLTKLNKMARVERFRAESMQIDFANLGDRVMMSKREAADPQRRAGISHSQIRLTPSDVVVPIEISDKYLRQNLQGRSMEDKILSLMAIQFANDQELLAINGNTLGPAIVQSELPGGSSPLLVKDDVMGLQQGWSQLANGGNVLDAEGANINPAIFNLALQELPEKYQRDIDQLRFLLPTNLDHKYNNKISQRQTAGGDAALAGSSGDSFGVPRMKVPLWGLYPVIVEHVTLTGTTPTQLDNAPIKEIVAVTGSDLGLVPEAGFAETADYVVDYTAGTITRNGAGSIGSGAVVKVTYRAFPQMLLTNSQNLVIGIGMEIKVLKAREIFQDVHQFAMHASIGLQIQNTDAMVKIKNIGDE